jgi:hypothetical protein
MFMAMKQGKTRLRVADIAFYGTGSLNYGATEETKIYLQEFEKTTLKSKQRHAHAQFVSSGVLKKIFYIPKMHYELQCSRKENIEGR